MRIDLGGRRRGGTDTQFHRLFDAAAEPLALLDREGRIRAANPALVRLVGPALPLRPGLAAASLIAANFRPGLAERIAAATARAPEPPPLRAPPVAPAEPDAEWEIGCRAIAGAARDEDVLLLRIADRTEAKRAEQRLREASRLETVGRLAGGIAHDFNNLLTAILGAAEAAAAAPNRDDAACELRQIEDAARRGAGLVGQLLAFARQQVLRPVAVDLNAAIESIAPLLRRLVGDQVTVELALEQPGRRVRVDPTQLDQVLMNLAANARAAMPDGGTLRFTTGRAVVLDADGPVPPGRYAVLEVADTGIGMALDVQEHIFEPFFTTRPEKGGTGLGLATVQGIIAQSGGHIAIESEPGKGTRFRMHLPRFDGAEEPPPLAPHLASQPGAALLLVEDEAPLRRLATRVLEKAGHTVRAVDSAEAALDMIAEGFTPCAVISDVAMPGLDGVALARKLRERWPALPVLLVSGYAPAACEADFGAERLAFLAKPYAPAELGAAVGTLLAA